MFFFFFFWGGGGGGERKREGGYKNFPLEYVTFCFKFKWNFKEIFVYRGQGLTLADLAKIIAFCLKFSSRKKKTIYIEVKYVSF